MRNSKTRWFLIAGMIVLAIVSRFVPHWHNFTAVGAVGLFAGALFKEKFWAFVVPFAALWMSDLFLNNVVYGHFYEGFVWLGQGAIWIYLGFAANVLIGMIVIKKIKVVPILIAALGASAAFFLITNFGSWASPFPPFYPKSFAGLLTAYGAGLPFFLNTILANLVFSFLLFGTYELVAPRIGVATKSIA